MSEASENYTHPYTIKGQQVHRLARLCIRRKINYAMVVDGAGWRVMCPAEQEEHFVAAIEDAKQI